MKSNIEVKHPNQNWFIYVFFKGIVRPPIKITPMIYSPPQAILDVYDAFLCKTNTFRVI